MNKNIFIGSLAAVMGLSLMSCNKEGYNEIQRTLGGPAISIITSLSDDNVIVTPGTYAFYLKITDSSTSGTVASPDLIADNTSLKFTTNDQGYKSTGYDAFFENATGTVGNTTMELNNANFLASFIYDEANNKYGYYYDETKIGDYTFNLNPYAPYITVAKYNIGSSYRVNTFPIESFFKGTTRTTYPANPQGFQTSDITYRFSIKKDKDSNVYTADLILYNARFAAEMPMALTAVLVEDLDVEFTSTGVRITTENKIPKWFTNGEFLPLDRYIFKSVEFNTTNEYYTTGSLRYHVGEDYDGYFEGSYLNSNFIK